MILLDSYHTILYETLKNRIEGDRSDSLLLRISDFDGALYMLSTLSTNKAILRISMQLKCFHELKELDVQKALESKFSTYLSSETESNYDVTLQLDLDAIAKDPTATDFVLQHVPQMKRHAMACIFNKAFGYHSDKKISPVLAVNYREDEGIYLQSMQDRVTVIFAIQFKEEADRVFAKVFLQEFVDARRQSACQNAPHVLYTSRDPPLELRNLSNVPSGINVGYVTFVLFPRHLVDEATREATITRILTFRNYLHYHIKCAKAFLHCRMRAKVDSFLKVLNRAKMEPETSSAQKSSSGRPISTKAQ